MKTINLEELTGDGKVQNLSGRIRGLAARELFRLNELDASDEDAELIVPSYVYSLTPSFVQGLLGDSVRATGNDVERFRRRFKFVAPAVVLQQLERGLSAILTDRSVDNLR